MRILCGVLFPLTATLACATADRPLLPGFRPTREVTLVVDDLGITHVLAGSDADAMYGGGYAMTRDCLGQTCWARRATPWRGFRHVLGPPT